MKQIIKSSLVVLLLVSGLAAHAQQRLTFGVKSGFAFSDLSDFPYETATKHAFTGGLTFDYVLNNPELYISSGIDFVNKGTKYDLVSDEVQTDARVTFKKSTIAAMYVQVPLFFGYKVRLSDPMNFFIQAGPYAAYGIGGKRELGGKVNVETLSGTETIPLHDFLLSNNYGIRLADKAVFDKDEGFKRFDYGVGVAMTFEYEHVGLTFKYDLGLAEIDRMAESKIKNRTAYVTFGYRF